MNECAMIRKAIGRISMLRLVLDGQSEGALMDPGTRDGFMIGMNALLSAIKNAGETNQSRQTIQARSQISDVLDQVVCGNFNLASEGLGKLEVIMNMIAADAANDAPSQTLLPRLSM